MFTGFLIRPMMLSARNRTDLIWSRWVWLMRMSVILLCASMLSAAVIVPASSIMTSFTRKPGGIVADRL